MLYIFLLPIVVISLLALPVVYAIKAKKSFKKAILGNVCTFAAVMIAFTAAAPTVLPAVAAETAAPAAESVQAEESASADGMRYLAAALAVGLGSIGGGLAVAAVPSLQQEGLQLDSFRFLLLHIIAHQHAATASFRNSP